MIFIMNFHRSYHRLFFRPLNPGLTMKYTVFILLLVCNLVYADAREIDDFRWEGVERIVAIGDLHGDYENYL